MNSFDLDEPSADWQSLGSPATDLAEGVRQHERSMRRRPPREIAAVGEMPEQFREAATADLA